MEEGGVLQYVTLPRAGCAPQTAGNNRCPLCVQRTGKKKRPFVADTRENRVEERDQRRHSLLPLNQSDGTTMDDKAGSDKVELKRDVGLWSGIALIMGTMIGSGIFISPKGMLEGSGSVGMTLILWLLCGLLVTMGIIAFVNCASVKAATIVQNVTTFTKLLALAIISFGGIVKLIQGNTENFEDGFAGTTSEAGTVAIAFYNGLWAFDGWNSLNFITEELKDPTKNLPRAIMIGIPLTTLAYVLANIGYLAVMTKEEIMISHAVAVTWGDRMLGVMSWLIPCFVVASTFGSSNGCLFASGRLTFSAGREGHFPKVLSFLRIGANTPVPAVMFTTLLSLCLIIPGDLSTLIDFFSFASWLFYGLTTASLLILRVTEPKMHRPYKVPIPVPVIVLLASIYLVIAPIVQNPGVQFVYAVIFILAGLVVYIPFIYNGIHFKFVDTVTIFIQKLLQLAPPGQ
ncbi:B(0,+)-type amino acid transporter 1 [Elysia marginata]|uniref:B(0,+)-type amino acid transporter 1 n=1 Tax=Elysia marginata TaxID=1093978 RepID=A0AAV4GBU9_9GAST|nr:B(0,+)-type amino acid transporter 1 [Elysia marginata]